MNYYAPRELMDKDGKPTGRFHYTCRNDDNILAIGYCSPTELCPSCKGHCPPMFGTENCAENAAAAVAQVVTEAEGRGAENVFDPLVTCNFMIWEQGLKVCGLGLMGTKEDGGEYCPICEALRIYAEWWIDGPAEAALTQAREKGLIPPS